jgi:hypothetical protein
MSSFNAPKKCRLLKGLSVEVRGHSTHGASFKGHWQLRKPWHLQILQEQQPAPQADPLV